MYKFTMSQNDLHEMSLGCTSYLTIFSRRICMMNGKFAFSLHPKPSPIVSLSRSVCANYKFNSLLWFKF